MSSQGRELIAAWSHLDRGMAAFVLQLAEFDASGDWAEDGFASCVSWLSDKCGLGRSDAFDKLKVAHELTRRYVVRDAFEEGLPYSKVRLLVRLEGLDHERDQLFVGHAKADSMRVLEERVKNWNHYATQDKPPTHIDDHYGIRRERGFGGGFGRLVMEAPDEMFDRLFALLDAYGEFLGHNGSPCSGLGVVDQSRVWTDPQGGVYDDASDPFAAVQVETDSAAEVVEPEGKRRPRSARRLDCLFDLLEEAALADPHKLDPYVAAVGVTIQYEDLIAGTGAGLSDQGSVLSGDAVRRLACDAGIHRVVVKGVSEILDFGREQRLFSRAQRRAIRFRHGNVCCVKGCGRRITQIHHLDWWEHGGETNINLGLPNCSYHHHLIHDDAWQIEYDPATGLVRYLGPKGQTLETTAEFNPRLVA